MDVFVCLCESFREDLTIGTVSLTACALLAGCGSDSTEPAMVASVVVAPTSTTLIIGDTTRLIATVKDGAGYVLNDRLVTWASSNPAVAAVSTTGLVSGMRGDAQPATITATSEGVSGSALITVSPGLPRGAVALAAGGRHTCGLTGSGAIYCWGSNWLGQLGDGSTADSKTPVAVAGALSFSAFTAGRGEGLGHTCGLTSAGVGYCWGHNLLGELGDGSRTNSTTPVAVAGGLRFSALTGGEGHTCGLTSDSAAYCWGLNMWGQLGNGSTSMSTTPVVVAGGLKFTALVAGFSHTCGLTSSGAAHCWGRNLESELGLGSTSGPDLCPNAGSCSIRPAPVSTGLSFSALAAGGYHTCALTSSGAAYCWGWNRDGQLGLGSSSGPDLCGSRPCSLTPVAITGGLSFGVLAAAGLHTCGLTSDNAGYCWGLNTWGQLGNRSTMNSPAPVAVDGGLRFNAFALGSGDHTCALTTAGVAYCWGRNTWGNLGDGTTNDSSTPVRVVGQAGNAASPQ